MDDFRTLIDGYDCGIAYNDEHIGQVLEALRAKGVGDDLAIIISSDHGENMGELGIYAEHGTADTITCRVPLIIRWPGCTAGHVDQGLHYGLDLLPTLAGLLNQKAAARWDGQSFAPALTAGQECGRETLVISQCAHVAQRSVRWGQWLYMRSYHDGYHLFPDEMLYDVVSDPHLQQDLAEHEPGVCMQARALLASWQDEMQASMPAGYTVDPMRTVLAEGGPFHARGNLRRYLQRLRESGRASQAEQLAQRHPDEI
jgi:arylsulfatase A-like enzyme